MVVNVFLALNTNFSTILYLLLIVKGINPYHQWHVTHLIILALTPTRPGKGPRPTAEMELNGGQCGPWPPQSFGKKNFTPL
jgi:hypothetical protein